MVVPALRRSPTHCKLGVTRNTEENWNIPIVEKGNSSARVLAMTSRGGESALSLRGTQWTTAPRFI